MGKLIINGDSYGGAIVPTADEIPYGSTDVASALDALSNEKANTTDVYGTSDEYNSVASYVVGDMCIYNGKLYKCIKACSGVAPTDTDYWENVSLSNMMEKFDYSTEEKVIGTWVDGKRLYMKSFEYKNLTATGVQNFSFDFTNIKSIVKFDYVANRYGGSEAIQNGFYADDYDKFRVWFERAYSYVCYQCSNGFSPGFDIFLTIYYTKTTD